MGQVDDLPRLVGFGGGAAFGAAGSGGGGAVGAAALVVVVAVFAVGQLVDAGLFSGFAGLGDGGGEGGVGASERTVQYHLDMLRETGLLAYRSKGTRLSGRVRQASHFERIIPTAFDTT
ncbi:hypothetical protein EAO77_38515, partial [Streptomyces sp. t39]